MSRRLRFELALCWACVLVLPLTAAGQSAALGSLRWGMRPDAVQSALGARLTSLPQAPGFVREAGAGASDLLLRGHDALSRTFYVFRAQRLRMLYVLFEPLTFPEGNFAAFAAHLERRFGPGSWGSSGQQRFIAWHDRDSHMRAIDQTNRHGFYCLVLQSR